MYGLIGAYAIVLYYLHPDKLHIVFMIGLRRCIVYSTRRKVVVGVLNDVRIVEVTQDGQEEAAVPVICHPPTIVTLSSQICDGLKGNILILIHKELQNRNTGSSTNVHVAAISIICSYSGDQVFYKAIHTATIFFSINSLCTLFMQKSLPATA